MEFYRIFGKKQIITVVLCAVLMVATLAAVTGGAASMTAWTYAPSSKEGDAGRPSATAVRYAAMEPICPRNHPTGALGVGKPVAGEG